MTTYAGPTTTTAVDRLLLAIAAADVPEDLFTPDARLDATVPGWRFPVRGSVAVRTQFSLWFRSRARIEELHRAATPAGEVIDYTLAWKEGGTPYASHHVHIVTVEGDRIAADRFWCGGRWSADLLAEMEAAARRSGHAC